MSGFWCLAGLDALARILLETASNQARELGRQVAPHVGDGGGSVAKDRGGCSGSEKHWEPGASYRVVCLPPRRGLSRRVIITAR
jgi:hypothetical protein